MPKKKPIAKRLKNLFEDLKPEQAPAELNPAPHQRVSEEKRIEPVEERQVMRPKVPVELVSPASHSDSTLSLAFQAGQESWATLQVADETEQRKWTQDEQLLVKQVADQLSLALENARLFQETQSRAEELSVLNEMGRELSTKLEVSAIADVVYRYTSRLMDTRNFFIALYDQKIEEKSYPLAFEEGRQIEMRPSKLGNGGFSDYIIRNKKAVFAPNNVLGHMKALGINFVPLKDDETPSQSWLGVPLMIGERVLGLISVQSVQHPNIYDEHDRDILTTITSQAAIAIENARLFQEAQRRAQETAALAEVGREISVTLDLETVLTRIAFYAKELLQAETSAVYLPEAQGTRWNAISVIGADAEEIKSDPISAGEGILGKIILQKVGQIVNDADNQSEALTIRGTADRPFEHIMGVPFLSADTVTGLMAVWRTGESKEFAPAELEFLTSLARQAAIAIENARLFNEVTSSQGQLSEALRIARLGYFEIDPNRQTIQVTDELYSLLGTNAEREGGYQFPLDQVVQKFILEEDIPVAYQAFQEAINAKHGSDIKSEIRYITTDGKVIWVSSIYKVERDEHGQLIKIAGSSQDINERKTNELIHSAITQISESALTSTTIYELSKSVHEAISVLLPAKNFYIARYEPTTNLIIFPYHMDELDDDWSPRKLGRGLTSYVIRTGQPLRTSPEIFADLQASGEVVNDGALSVDWLGVPLRSQQVVTGVIAIQTYDHKIHITEHHKEILTTIAAQVAFAIERLEAREALAKSEAEFRALFSAMEDVIIVYDKDGRYVRVAPTNQAQLFRPPEEMLGKTVEEVLPESLHEPFMSTIHRVLAGEENVSLEYFLPPSGLSGQGYWKDARVTKLTEDQVFWVARDITDRKKSEEALRESDARLRSILETAIDAFISIDSQGLIMAWNSQATQIFGWTSEEAIGRELADLIIPEVHRDAHRRGMARFLATGEGPVLNNRIEIIGLHQDGHVFPVELAITSVPTACGVTFGAFIRDITERKRSEEAIRRRNEYLAASAEIGRLVTSTLDLNTIFTRTVSLISERFRLYFAAIYIIEETGFSAVLREATGEAGEKMKAQRYSVIVGSKSVVGKVAERIEPILVDDTELEPLYVPNPFLLDTRSEVAIPLRIGTRSVGVIDIQSTQTHAFTEDDLSVLQSLADQVAVAIDNARSYELSQQLIQELREIDLLKSQFLANMSHELRTPLNSIIGFSRVILKGIDGPVTEMQQQDLTAIYNSGQHLLGLINDILDLARIEAGKMELNFEEVHLAEMTTSVMATAKGLIKEKPIQLQQRIPSDMSTVRGDAMRVRQILLNLISNAAKFTDEGSITVETLVQRGSTGKLEALINVIDTGPGISAEDQNKLFQAFSQVDGSATRKSGGTGLGLSICANLVQLHGGRIGVHSEVGKGSVFWFTLPLYHQPEEEIPEGKKIVLAIDDDPQVIGLYERYLNPQGYFVLPLTDPSKAKEQVLKVKPYAITLDLMMPNKDGWSVLTELKSDPATRDCPVIICSILEQADKGFSLGAADYLVKPILEEDLVQALDRLNKNGTIHEVLVIDDDPNDLRLIEKILNQHGQYKPILAEGGHKGWEAISAKAPQAIILDIFMPEMNGFNILEKLRESPSLREIPVLVVSGGGLTNEQQQQLDAFGQRLITKGSLNEVQLIESIENALKRLSS
jgi:PAS domain S-box-containing protein